MYCLFYIIFGLFGWGGWSREIRAYIGGRRACSYMVECGARLVVWSLHSICMLVCTCVCVDTYLGLVCAVN